MNLATANEYVQEIARLHAEIERLRLTDAEREAVESALWDLEQAPDDPGCASSAATLRGLLARLG